MFVGETWMDTTYVLVNCSSLVAFMAALLLVHGLAVGFWFERF